jgi:uncharacterized membrane protein
MSAFGGKADIANSLQCLLLTQHGHLHPTQSAMENHGPRTSEGQPICRRADQHRADGDDKFHGCGSGNDCRIRMFDRRGFFSHQLHQAIMENPLIIGLIVFAVILIGAFVGGVVRQSLPKHQLTDETKSTVSVSMAVVATFSALVLGLLISNANTSFSALGGEVTTLSAQILRLDQLLRRYGPEAGPATLRRYAELKTDDLFPDNPANVRLADPRTYELLQQLEDSILALRTVSARDKWWLDQAMTLAGKIGDTRWLLTQQAGQGTPKAFIALLVFWLTLLFASFGLFAPRNLTSAAAVDRSSPRLSASWPCRSCGGCREPRRSSLGTPRPSAYM